MRRTPLPVVVLLGLLTLLTLWLVASRSGDDTPPAEPLATDEQSERLPLTGEARETDRGSVDHEPPEVVEPTPGQPVEFKLPRYWFPMPDEVEVWLERGQLVVALEAGENPANHGERGTAAVENGAITLELGASVSSVTILAASRRARWDAAYGGKWERTPRDLPVLVRVKDSRGRALVGIPITLEFQSGGGRSSAGRPARTGLPDGVAILSAPRQSRRGGALPQDVYATLAVPTRTPVTVHVPADHLPGAVLDLQAPPLASLDVRLLDGNGRPYTGACSVRVTLDLQGNPYTGYAKTTYTTSTGGRVLVPFVPENAPLTIEVHPQDPAHLPVTVTHEGVKGGRTEQVRIAIASSSVAVTGRLVDESGAPVAGSVRVSVLGRESFEGNAEADETGAFRVILSGRPQPGHAASPPERLLRVGASATLTDGSSVYVTRDVQVEGWLTTAAYDVGTLRLTKPVRTVVAAGRITGADGAPRHRAQVAVESRNQAGEWSRTRLYARADEQGRFEVIGNAPQRPLRLIGNADWDLEPRAVPFEAGVPDLRVVAAQRGRIIGRFVRQNTGGFPPVTLEIWSGDDPPSQVELMYGGPQGSFSITRPPGTYGVRLRLRGSGEPIATATGIHVTEGGTVSPPELREIALEQVVRTLAVTVIDPAGEPLADAIVWSRPSGASKGDGSAAGWSQARPDAQGRVELMRSAEGGLDVLADARGRKSVLVKGLRADKTILLQEGSIRTITVRMPASIRSLSPRDSYHVGAQWLGTSGEPIEGLAARTDPRASHRSEPISPGGTARIRVRHAGRYGIRLGVQRAYDGGGFGLSVGPLSVYGLLTLEGTLTEGEIVVSPTEAELDDAVRRMDADSRSER